MQSTNEELTEVALTMLLKVFREGQCDLFNVMTVGNIETKGNKMAKLAGFLVCEVHQIEILKVMWQTIFKKNGNMDIWILRKMDTYQSKLIYKDIYAILEMETK